MKQQNKRGRIIRRYGKHIARKDFDAWSDKIRRRNRGYGLYALYDRNRLVYVGLATNSIKSRIYRHSRTQRIHFTRFSVFLIAGKSCDDQRRRIRDLEALLLNIVHPRPHYNRSVTRFIAAKRLQTG